MDYIRILILCIVGIVPGGMQIVMRDVESLECELERCVAM
ncbi:hypothetical protein ANO14919_064290 [Xylariales sp. No.14919]|nr:hypothetical protein ANO14919_064290 [Xylariales sp. No.14919]